MENAKEKHPSQMTRKEIREREGELFMKLNHTQTIEETRDVARELYTWAYELGQADGRQGW